MRKKALWLLIVAIVMLFCGCNSVKLEIVAQTNLKIDTPFTQPFHNGYAIIYTLNDNPDLDSYSYIDKSGAILGGKRFYYASPFEDDGHALVQLMDKSWAYIDRTGEVVAPGEERMIGMGRDFPFYREGDLFGLTDEKGNRLTEAIYLNAGDFYNGLAYVQFAEGTHKNAFIDKTGNVKYILPDDWHPVTYAGDERIFYETGDNNNLKFRLYDLSGKLLNSTYFDMAGNFEDGLAPVMIENKLGLMDTHGNIVVEPYLVVDRFYLIGLYIRENLIVASKDSKLTIIKIIR